MRDWRRMLAVTRRLVADMTAYAGRGTFNAAALMIGAAVLDGVGLVLLIPILGVIISGPLDNMAGEILSALGLIDPAQQLAALLAAFVIASLLRAQVTWARDLVLGRIQLGFSRVQRIDIISRLANAGWDRLVEMSHARITSLINNDVSRAVSSAQFVLRIAVNVLLLAVNSVIAFALAPDLVLLLLALLALGLAFMALTQRDAFAQGDRVRESAKAMIGGTQNLLSGLKTALAQEQQRWFIDEFERVQLEVYGSQFGFTKGQADARRLFAVASALVAASLVAGGFWLEVPPARLIVVVVILSRLSGPVLQLQQGLQQLLFALPSVAAMQDMRAQLPDPIDRTASGSDTAGGEIELVEASYRHRDGGGFGPLSLHVREGEFLGLEGPSGAGKSTLVDVLAGLLAPQAGTLLIGGVEADAARLAAWHRGLAYLGQQTYLFNDTLRANLAWNEVPPSDEDIWQALERAGVAELVRGLEHGLDTSLGEHGALFSGGERQRIALARALLRHPRFLILDEATSAIDIASERGVLDALAAMPDRPTIVMVAHRRESLARCDRVISIDGGLLVADTAR